ncbi:MAG: hypothetical protein ABI629_03310 [bacterium]
MARTRGTTLHTAVAAVLLVASATRAHATNGCGEVLQLTSQGVSAEEIATAFNAPLSAVQACLQPRGAAAPARRAGIAPAGNSSMSAAGPAPFGAAGPAPFGAAGPAPFGAPGPAPFGAAGPAPFKAAGGTSTGPTTTVPATR